MNASDNTEMHEVDGLLSHVWMVRTFLKHSEEAAEDDELAEVHRVLYDVMLALGKPLSENNPEAYFKQLKKKYRRLSDATTLFAEIQPEISEHTNFKMALRSLQLSVGKIGGILKQQP